jgi:hypothetical protein
LDVSVAKEPPAPTSPSEAVDLDAALSTFRQDLHQYEHQTTANASRAEQNVKFIQLVKSFEELERARTKEETQRAETEGQLQASWDRLIAFD